MDTATFLEQVARYQREGWRLAVINATTVLPAGEDGSGDGDRYDVSWSFAMGSRLEHLRERLEPGEAVPSIGSLYRAAYLYENELRELFGIEVVGLDLDLGGQLYRTATRIPFSARAIQARLAARKGQS